MKPEKDFFFFSIGSYKHYIPAVLFQCETQNLHRIVFFFIFFYSVFLHVPSKDRHLSGLKGLQAVSSAAEATAILLLCLLHDSLTFCHNCKDSVCFSRVLFALCGRPYCSDNHHHKTQGVAELALLLLISCDSLFCVCTVRCIVADLLLAGLAPKVGFIVVWVFICLSVASAAQAFVLGCLGAAWCWGLAAPSVSSAAADTDTTPPLLPTPIVCIDLFLMRGSSPCCQVCPASQADCRRVEVLINH